MSAHLTATLGLAFISGVLIGSSIIMGLVDICLRCGKLSRDCILFALYGVFGVMLTVFSAWSSK